MRRTHTILTCLTMFAAVALIGCASYVNIPPQPGDGAIHRPDMIPVPTLMTNALMWATARYPVEPPFAVNLPADTPYATYNNVVNRGTRGRGLPMTAEIENLPTYHVAEIRIRGTRAQVDVVLPQGLEAAAVTVTYRHTAGAWRMQDSRSWIAGVISVPAPNYIPEAPPDGFTSQRAVSPAVEEDEEPPLPIETPNETVEEEAKPQADMEPPSASVEEEAPEQEAPILVVQSTPPAEKEPDHAAAKATRYVLHSNGTMSREGRRIDLVEAFAGLDQKSVVHLTIEQAEDGSEPPNAQAIIASFRIRGVENLTVTRAEAPQ